MEHSELKRSFNRKSFPAINKCLTEQLMEMYKWEASTSRQVVLAVNNAGPNYLNTFLFNRSAELKKKIIERLILIGLSEQNNTLVLI